MSASPLLMLAAMVLAGLIGVIAALWTWTSPGKDALYPAADAASAVPVQVLDNGFHTDLAIPRAVLEAVEGPLARAVRTLPPGDWILIGWGDARFYVETGPINQRLPDGARAFLRPGGNASVLMLYPRAGDPGAGFPKSARRRLILSPAGFEAMRAEIEATLRLSNGEATLAAKRPNDDARFFLAHGRFWVGNLCNHWTARRLNAAGLPVRPLRSVTSAEILAAVDRAQLDRRIIRD